MQLQFIFTIVLIVACLIAFLWGLVGLVKYAARASTGQALAVALVPFYAFYFAFYRLQEEGKSRPTWLYFFGLFGMIFLVALFWQPLSAAFRGDTSLFEPPTEEVEAEVTAIEDPIPVVAPAPTAEARNAAGAGTATGTDVAATAAGAGIATGTEAAAAPAGAGTATGTEAAVPNVPVTP